MPIEFGLKPPANYTGPAWGARAIFEKGEYIDLLPSRMGSDGEPEAVKALCTWIDKKGLPALRKLALTLRQNERREVRFEGDGYVIVADPKASYGYLYIGAWKL